MLWPPCLTTKKKQKFIFSITGNEHKRNSIQTHTPVLLVSHAAVFSVDAQCFSPQGALRDGKRRNEKTTEKEKNSFFQCPQHCTSRKDLQIYRPQKISNEALCPKTSRRDVPTIIKRKKRRWLRHVIRKDRNGVKRTALRCTPDNGRRKQGQPQGRWRTTIEAVMNTMGRCGARKLQPTNRGTLVSALRAT